MRPFTRIPGKVLATLFVMPLVLASAVLLYPSTMLVMAAAAVLVAALGGAWIAIEASARRNTPTLPGRGLPIDAVWWGAVFVTAAALLTAAAAPDLCFRDGGELASAAHLLGVAHPTGFPLFLVAGKAMMLVPAGSVFFRLNVASALWMAAAAATMFLVGSWNLRAPRAWMLVVPVAMLGTCPVWMHGTGTEVYAVSAAGLAAALLFFTAAASTGDARMAAMGWVITGLGAGGHVTWPVYGTVAGFIATLALPGWKRKSAAGLGAGAGIAAALLVIAYLPAAASRDTPANWGSPDNLEALWAHLSGARIRSAFANNMFSSRLPVLSAEFRMAWSMLIDGLGPTAALVVVGMAAMFRRAPVQASVLAAVAFLDLVFAAWINPMGTRDVQTLVSASMCAAVFAGWGAAALRGVVAARLRPVVLAGTVVVCAVQFTTAPVKRWLDTMWGPRVMAGQVFNEIPAWSSVLTVSDDLSAVLGAVQSVENARPDVMLLVRQHLADTRYVLGRLRAFSAAPADDALKKAVLEHPFESAGESPGRALSRLVNILSKRGPVFLEQGEAGPDSALRSMLEPGFPVSRLSGEGSGSAPAAADKALERALKVASSADLLGCAFVATSLRILATHLALSGWKDQAMRVLLRAAELSPGDSRILHNLGVMYRADGEADRALVFFRKAVEADPTYLRGWRSLARSAREAGLRGLEAEARARIEELAR